VTTTSRIVCTTLTYPNEHEHIVAVGTGTDPDKITQAWTVVDVRAAIEDGDTFYTSDGTNTALVSRYTCGCGYQTIRSASDSTTANNLDNLTQCNWGS
jgi:hypothetical protein